MLERLRQFVNKCQSSPDTREPRAYRTRKAAILHVDMVASTQRVRNNPGLAHRQIEQLYTRLCFVADMHNAIPRELRGDAAVIEFTSVADAILAAEALHAAHAAMSRSRLGLVNPQIRSGISFGDVVGENMITGEAVIRAQRLEQLSDPGQVLVDQSAADQLASVSEFELDYLGSRVLKGFGEPCPIFSATSQLGPSAGRQMGQLLSAASP